MRSISNDVLVKLTVELLTYAIVAGVVAGYREWWPKLKSLAARLWLGGEGRLAKLEQLITRYENFTRVEEMESQSKLHRHFANAFKMTILTFFISLPLVIIFVMLFGEAIVFDVVLNLKPGTALPEHPAKLLWASRIYGGVLGVCISVLWHFLDQASISASDLSNKYREERLTAWHKTREKLQAKLGHKALKAKA